MSVAISVTVSLKMISELTSPLASIAAAIGFISAKWKRGKRCAQIVKNRSASASTQSVTSSSQARRDGAWPIQRSENGCNDDAASAAVATRGTADGHGDFLKTGVNADMTASARARAGDA